MLNINQWMDTKKRKTNKQTNKLLLWLTACNFVHVCHFPFLVSSLITSFFNIISLNQLNNINFGGKCNFQWPQQSHLGTSFSIIPIRA